MSLENHLKSKFSLSFEELYSFDGLEKIDQNFQQFLAQKNPNLALEFQQKTSFDPAWMIEISKVLEDFIVELFDIKAANDELHKKHDELQKIYEIRREFAQRNVAKKYREAPQNFDGFEFLKSKKIAIFDIDDLEKNLAAEIAIASDLENLEKYCAWALYSSEGKKLHKKGALFILPQKIDQQNLVKNPQEKYKRLGFDLSDKGASLNRVLAESHYCIFCHKQEKDSCRKGLINTDITSSCHVERSETSHDLNSKFVVRDPSSSPQDDRFKKDIFGADLKGCPLDEKISEMNLLKSQGLSISALVMAVLDNPMIAGTGHRICNDCMKSCIYQKQDPVDIPQIETRVLKDVLSLPYGFEIYSLLTRWNPLNFKKNKSDKKRILVCGLGPAGYTLSHYLLNEGHDVVAIDGLKIEPLNKEISGIDEFGNRVKFKPIKFVDEIYEPLSKRLLHGFGGVAEYGITVRWDKNFLKIIRLLLERRNNFQMFGGIRFGSSITDKIAFEKYGFDHVALCIGAGRPNIINLKNNFAKGVRMASDFLMSLQLTGSFKQELFTNLQVRMPAIVIGGGLTAIDSACEIQSYYITQIRKFAKKVAAIGKEKLWASLNNEEKIIAEEFLSHAKDFEENGLEFLMKKVGGVKVLYRKKMQDSPAYRLNHQELQNALEEGIEFVENIAPQEVVIDEFNHIKALKCQNGEVVECRSLLVAAGTSPNISPKIEDGLDLQIEGKYFRSLNKNSFLTKIDEQGRAVSFLGDLHPIFEGNVVKAMASAKEGSKEILQNLLHIKSQFEGDFWGLIKRDFLVQIQSINRLSDHVVELVVKAPLLASQTKVGQIFRLQNYHVLAKEINGQIMAMEGVTVTALSVDPKAGLISGIVVETGGSTSLIKNFSEGEPCIFMGPSGKPTEIPQNETVVFVGGGRGNQPLTALAEAFSANGCKVLFFAGYRKKSYIVREERMKKSCAELIISIEDEPAQAGHFQGSVIDSLKNYFLTTHHLPLTTKIDRIFTIGNDRLMHEVAKLRHEKTIPAFAEAKHAIASLNSSMQCMLKGVCSQCLQKRVNEKGEVEFFYSCADQDQDMDRFDFINLHNRCEQNSLSEKMTRFWISDLGSKS